MENLNSVCFIAKINEVRAIEGADNIELVIAGGWNAITKKGEFKVGDETIIATTDAVIPEKLSEEMGVTSYLRKGGRVRTVKLRGVYSECLIIPTKYIPGYGDRYQDGDDMMEKFGIVKYEPPVKQIQLASGRKIKWRDNQNFHIYYKFPNLKNVEGMFTEEDTVQITRKIHGTNARYGIVRKSKLSFWDKVKKFLRIADEWIDYEYIYGSHNCEKGSDSQGFYSTDVWRTIAEKYSIKEKLWDYIKKYNPILLSSPSTSESSRIGKRLWVKKYMPSTKLILAYPDQKANYAGEGKILIDDREEPNIRMWRDKGGIGILHTSASDTISQLKELGL